MTAQPYVMPSSAHHHLDSKILNRPYEIYVALPPSYDRTKQSYPVLYVLDGQMCFAMAAELARGLAMGEAKEIIVVGIALPHDLTLSDVGKRRVYEFSGARTWDFTTPFGSIIKNLLIDPWGMKPEDALGGAPLLLQCLKDEILPLIAGRYRADNDDAALFGHSAAGNFVLYALFSGKSPFRKYICGSPATAYNDELVLRTAEEHARTHDDLRVEMFIAAGTAEMSDAFLEAGGIVSGVARVSGLFARRKYPSARIVSHLFEGEGHVSVVPAILARGMLVLWPGGGSIEEMHRNIHDGK